MKQPILRLGILLQVCAALAALGENVFVAGEAWDARRDAFGRLRISNPVSIFDSPGFQYDLRANVWESSTGGNGSVTLNASQTSVILTNGVGGTTNYAMRTTYERFRHRAGKSLLVMLTGVLGVQPSGVRATLGYGDLANGVFFENWAGTNAVVLRSSASGTTNETRIPASDWSGSSSFDASKVNVYAFDISSLGGGSVRCYHLLGPEWRQVAVFNNANTLAYVFMGTARLPILYRIENTGAAAAASMQQIASSVFIEGGDDEGTGNNRWVGTAAAGVAVSSAQAVIGIRPSLTLGGRTNRARIRINGISANAPNTRLSLVYKPDGVAGAAWTNVAGAVTYDLNGTTVTNGATLAAWEQGASVPLDLCSHPLTLNFAGTTATELYLVATPVSGTNTVSASINFVEDY